MFCQKHIFRIQAQVCLYYWPAEAPVCRCLNNPWIMIQQQPYTPKKSNKNHCNAGCAAWDPLKPSRKQQQFQESRGEWLLQEQERMVELSARADTITDFANIIGPGHMDQDTFLAVAQCYAIRKELLPDYAGKRCVPTGPVDYLVVAAANEDKRPPSPAGQGLSAQMVAGLVQMLAATKLENERLRAVAIPGLNRQQLECLIAESLPYPWMQTLALALKA